VAFTMDSSGNFKGYLNGIVQTYWTSRNSFTSRAYPNLVATDSNYIGKSHAAADGPTNAKFKNFRIYNRVLDEDGVENDMNSSGPMGIKNCAKP
jgi:hypothetical protein